MSDSVTNTIEDLQFTLSLKKSSKTVRRSAKELCKPFVKWAGGKGSLIAELIKRLPNNYDNYFEPFLGGGALFFALRPQSGVLLDINPDLINTYKVVRDHVDALISDLKKHYYDKEYFLKVRDLDRSQDFLKLNNIEKASRFIFLNRTCFNGLYRVNSKGQFNVPFGRYKDPVIVNESNLRLCSKALKQINILQDSFENIISRVNKNDFVYFDPPYAPVSKTANFTSYTLEGFDLSKQELLAGFCAQLDKKGVKFMLSNSSTNEIHNLYKSFTIERVHAPRAINSKATKRGAVEEIIVRNY